MRGFLMSNNVLVCRHYDTVERRQRWEDEQDFRLGAALNGSTRYPLWAKKKEKDRCMRVQYAEWGPDEYRTSVVHTYRTPYLLLPYGTRRGTILLRSVLRITKQCSTDSRQQESSGEGLTRTVDTFHLPFHPLSLESKYSQVAPAG